MHLLLFLTVSKLILAEPKHGEKKQKGSDQSQRGEFMLLTTHLFKDLFLPQLSGWGSGVRESEKSKANVCLSLCK